MRHIIAILIIVLCTSIAAIYAQQPTEFPIGVFTFGGNDVDYLQMKDTLGLTWVQGWGGWNDNSPALKSLNTPRLAGTLEGGSSLSLQTDPDWVKRFQVSPPPDTIIHLPDQTIYFYDKDITKLKALGIIP